MVSKRTSIFFPFFICVAGTVLFYLKYSVMDIEDRIFHAKRELKTERSNQHILKAEWKALNSPERVQNLALKHLNMQQIHPKQLKEYDSTIFHKTPRQTNTKRLSKIIAKLASEVHSEE